MGKEGKSSPKKQGEKQQSDRGKAIAQLIKENPERAAQLIKEMLNSGDS